MEKGFINMIQLKMLMLECIPMICKYADFRSVDWYVCTEQEYSPEKFSVGFITATERYFVNGLSETVKFCLILFLNSPSADGILGGIHWYTSWLFSSHFTTSSCSLSPTSYSQSNIYSGADKIGRFIFSFIPWSTTTTDGTVIRFIFTEQQKPVEKREFFSCWMQLSLIFGKWKIFDSRKIKNGSFEL